MTTQPHDASDPPAISALAQQAVQTLSGRGLTLSTAETDTGGGIGAALIDISGVSAVFRGGVTAYANAPKQSLLSVPHALLREYGAVSPEAVLAMAEGARQAFATDIAIAESGITGPGGGSADRPVGTVWIVCLGPGDRHVVERQTWTHDRSRNKQATIRRALELIVEAAEPSAAPWN